jgi:histidine triad (HIT) family protein
MKTGEEVSNVDRCTLAQGRIMSNDKPCVFCEIVADKANSYRVHEDQYSIGILDINPFAQGHCLVISKRHVPWWHDLSPEETESLFGVARIVADKIKNVFKPDFVCMYARGRRIPHTHIFLVPTRQGDLLDRFFNALEGFQESPEALIRIKEKALMEETAKRLRNG